MAERVLPPGTLEEILYPPIGEGSTDAFELQVIEAVKTLTAPRRGRTFDDISEYLTGDVKS